MIVDKCDKVYIATKSIYLLRPTHITIHHVKVMFGSITCILTKFTLVLQIYKCRSVGKDTLPNTFVNIFGNLTKHSSNTIHQNRTNPALSLHPRKPLYK